jgi:hypothetical protein
MIKLILDIFQSQWHLSPQPNDVTQKSTNPIEAPPNLKERLQRLIYIERMESMIHSPKLLDEIELQTYWLLAACPVMMKAVCRVITALRLRRFRCDVVVHS